MILYFNNKNERIETERPNMDSVYYTEIRTEKTKEQFTDDFEKLRACGLSIVEAIKEAI